jgi:hypothetical protein
MEAGTLVSHLLVLCSHSQVAYIQSYSWVLCSCQMVVGTCLYLKAVGTLGLVVEVFLRLHSPLHQNAPMNVDSTHWLVADIELLVSEFQVVPCCHKMATCNHPQGGCTLSVAADIVVLEHVVVLSHLELGDFLLVAYTRLEDSTFLVFLGAIGSQMANLAMTVLHQDFQALPMNTYFQMVVHIEQCDDQNHLHAFAYRLQVD